MTNLFFEGKTLDECLEAAQKKLNCDKSLIGYSIVEKKDTQKDRFFDRTFYKIEVFIKSKDIQKAERLLESTVNKLFDSVADIPEVSEENKNLYNDFLQSENNKKNDKDTSLDDEIVDGILMKSEDKFMIFYSKEDNESKEPYIKIYVSIDKMHLFASKSEGKMKFSPEKFIEALNNIEIVYGIKIDLLAEFINKQEAVEDIEIATGKMPIHGKDAELIFHESFKEKHEIDFETPNIDFKQLGYVKKVKKGDTVLSIIPPTQGEDGMNLLGNVIKSSNGKPKTVIAGENIMIMTGTKGETLYLSKITGNADFSENVLSVKEVVVIDGDVDYKVGNIEYSGNVLITGKILSGFSVKAGKDLKVMNNIQSAKVIVGGNLEVNGGIISREKGHIECRGNITARYADSGNIFSLGSVHIEKEIIHSEVSSNDEIVCTSNIGKIIGGSLSALNKIECNILGTEYGVNTNINLGETFLVANYAKKVKPELQQYETRIREINKVKTRIKQLISNTNDLTEKMKEDLNKLCIEEVNCKKKMLLILSKLKEFKLTSKKNLKAELIVNDVLYPPVTIKIGSHSKIIDKIYHHCRIFYSFDHHDFVIKGSLK